VEIVLRSERTGAICDGRHVEEVVAPVGIRMCTWEGCEIVSMFTFDGRVIGPTWRRCELVCPHGMIGQNL